MNFTKEIEKLNLDKKWKVFIPFQGFDGQNKPDSRISSKLWWLIRLKSLNLEELSWVWLNFWRSHQKWNLNLGSVTFQNENEASIQKKQKTSQSAQSQSPKDWALLKIITRFMEILAPCFGYHLCFISASTSKWIYQLGWHSVCNQ